MALYLASFKATELSAATLTSVYILTLLSHRYPGGWLGARRPSLNLQHSLNVPLTKLKEFGLTFEKNIEKRLEKVENLGDLLNNFALKSTPETVNRSLLLWSKGDYDLTLMFRIPDSQEVLDQQMNGRRCVSVLINPERTSSYILGERDALSFTMHDLIHADHFFHHPESHEGQLGFYALMDFCMREKHFEIHMTQPKFSGELDYLISDMNAYAVHLLKCLKAALYFYHPEGQLFFEEWIKKIKLSETESKAFLELNTKFYVPETQDAELLGFLSRWKRHLPK